MQRSAPVGCIHVFGLFANTAWLLALMKSAGRLPYYVIALEALCPLCFADPGLTGSSFLLRDSYAIRPPGVAPRRG